MTKTLMLIGLLALATGCDGELNDDLAMEGEACERSGDCDGDLRCIDQVCTGEGGGDGDTDSDSDGDTDGDSDSDADGSAGCGKDPTGIALTLEVGGATRNFEIYVPSDYDPSRAYPLIFGLHGGGGTAAGYRSYCGLDEEVGSDAVVVYPDGLDGLWILDPEGEDFVFFDDLLDHLKANLCVDETRVFATGWSLGGYMVNGLGCYRADVFKAIASCSGGTPGPKPPDPPYADCDGQVPAMVIHGTSDPVIPLAEGEGIRDVFVENNGCEQTTSPTDPDPCVAYDGCETPTHWCEFGGGHEWPDFAAEAAWQFFSSLDQN